MYTCFTFFRYLTFSNRLKKKPKELAPNIYKRVQVYTAIPILNE